jgi:hypothetical protein
MDRVETLRTQRQVHTEVLNLLRDNATLRKSVSCLSVAGRAPSGGVRCWTNTHTRIPLDASLSVLAKTRAGVETASRLSWALLTLCPPQPLTPKPTPSLLSLSLSLSFSLSLSLSLPLSLSLSLVCVLLHMQRQVNDYAEGLLADTFDLLDEAPAHARMSAMQV